MILPYYLYNLHHLRFMEMLFSKIFLICTFKDKKKKKKLRKIGKKLDPTGLVGFAYSNSGSRRVVGGRGLQNGHG